MTTTAAMYSPLFRAKSKKKPTEKKSKESAVQKKHSLKETLYGVLEAKTDELGRKVFPVTIIRQGLGNLHDRNYYTADAVRSGVEAYNGKKAYYNHPTQTEERERPGRSVTDIVGHYENVRAEKDPDGLISLKGDLVPIKGDSKKDVTDILEHAIDYKKKFPDKDFIGVSINGDGEGAQMEYQDFLDNIKPSKQEMAKISQVEGQPINVITKLTAATSADLVTEAGAGGSILKESKKLMGPLFSKQFKTVNKESKTLRGNNMLDAVKKLFRGISENNKEVIEGAVKEMQQGEGKEAEGENEKKEAEAKKGMYEAIMKKMKQLGKDAKKADGDSDEAHEAKMLQAACEAYEKEQQESEKKEGKDEKEDQGDQMKADKSAKDGDKKGAAGAAKDDGDGDDDSKEKKEKSKEGESEGENEKKEKEKKEKEGEKKEGEGEGKKDPMEAMKAEMESMKKEIESLKKEKKESDDSAKSSKESAAQAKAELHIKKRNELINHILGESHLPASVQDEYRRVLKECKTDEEIKALGKKLVEAGRSLIEQSFIKAGQTGFAEKQSYSKDENTDSEFLK